MSPMIRIVIRDLVIAIDVVELTITALTCALYMISRKYLYTKFEIPCIMRANKQKIFWIVNDIISLLLILGIVFVSTDIQPIGEVVFHGYTVQYI